MANSSPRIGYLVPEFPSQTHAFFWRELRALREQGLDVDLLSTRRPPEGACRHEFADRARSETTYLFPPRWGAALSLLLRRPGRALAAVRYVLGLRETPLLRRLRLLGLVLPAAELARRAVEKGFVHVHVHSCANAAHVAALSRTLGGPTYSLTLHGDLPVYGTDHRAKCGAAAFVSAVTRPLQAQLVESVGLALERVPVIWMGVDVDRFRPAQRVDSQAGRPFTIVTVARLNETKGHVHAMRALKLAQDRGASPMRYEIAGEGPYRDAIEREVVRLGLSNSVTLLGSLSEDGVRELLDRVDAFCLPSFGLGEAAPVSVMEALACGLPVVCSIIGGTRDMIEDGVDGILVEQQDEAGLARAFEALASDPALRARLSGAARARAERDFDYRVTAGRLAEHLRAAAAAVPAANR